MKSNVAILLFNQLRPKQWTKNILVFAALLFTVDSISVETILETVAAFMLFSLVSGCVYILNDYFDIESDRLHPTKRFRPMASGELSPRVAIVFGTLLLTGSLFTAYLFNMAFMLVLLVYFLLNIAYSVYLKHVVIVDVMTIATGFVLRAIGGGLIIEVDFTSWFLLTVMLLALFLAISKRRHEVYLLEEDKSSHRKVLDHYSLPFLDQLIGIVTTSTIITYSLFTFTSDHSIHLMWTIPLVIYGIFRYLYLVHVQKSGGEPDRVLVEDKPILITVLLYALSVFVILYFF